MFDRVDPSYVVPQSTLRYIEAVTGDHSAKFRGDRVSLDVRHLHKLCQELNLLRETVDTFHRAMVNAMRVGREMAENKAGRPLQPGAIERGKSSPLRPR